MNGVMVGTRATVPVETADTAACVRAAQVDPVKFATLYRRFVGPVHRYVCSRVGNRDDAEDITAETFADALAALPRYREQGEFAAWLFRIARRRCADHLRRRRPTTPIEDVEVPVEPFAGVERAIERDVLVRAVRRKVARLDADERDLLALRFGAGLTYGEIGAVLGRQGAAVKMAVHRLVDRLAEDLEANDERTH
jgi:RNA polymerase sigma-70 factor, ECF subfamily